MCSTHSSQKINPARANYTNKLSFTPTAPSKPIRTNSTPQQNAQKDAAKGSPVAKKHLSKTDNQLAERNTPKPTPRPSDLVIVEAMDWPPDLGVLGPPDFGPASAAAGGRLVSASPAPIGPARRCSSQLTQGHWIAEVRIPQPCPKGRLLLLHFPPGTRPRTPVHARAVDVPQGRLHHTKVTT